VLQRVAACCSVLQCVAVALNRPLSVRYRVSKALDDSDCKSFSAKEPLIPGFFCDHRTLLRKIVYKVARMHRMPQVSGLFLQKDH